jgi:hypothetical protein
LGAVQVQGGARPETAVSTKDDLVVVLPRQMGKNIEREIHTPKSLQAPVSTGQAVGTVTAVVDGVPQGHVEIVTSAPVAPRVWTASVATPWTGAWMILAAFLFGSRYARAFTKGSRRRRRRVAAGRGDFDREWKGHR